MALPIGGFMPIPLAMMIPFMATQSMVMGDAFGRAFQYGKRKISAMSNEEFNATTIEEQAANMFKSYKLIIPKLNEAIDDSSELQRKIISEMLLILPKFVSETGTQIFGGTDIKTEIEDHAHSVNRPHLHSGNITIIGTTTSNGITTTHYSDGSTTTSEKITTPAPKNISVNLTESLSLKAGVTQDKELAQLNIAQKNYNAAVAAHSVAIKRGNKLTIAQALNQISITGRIRDDLIRTYVDRYSQPKLIKGVWVK